MSEKTLEQKAADREYGIRWRAKNADRVKANRKRYAEANREKVRIAAAEWAKNNPERRKAYATEYVKKNAARIKARRAAYHQKNKEATREALLRKLYGISGADKKRLLQSQGDRCAVCLTDTPTKNGWVVDHDHTTGKVRGILCSPCNSGIGQLRDDVDIVARAVAYLKERA